VEKILAAAEEPYRTVYWLAVETGMRSGELSALRIEDVNLEAGAIRVSRAVWRGQLQSPKSLASFGSLQFRPCCRLTLKVTSAHGGPTVAICCSLPETERPGLQI